MLGKAEAIATVGVKDIKKAEKFYGTTLGLKRSEEREEPGTLTYSGGSSKILVYESSFAGTNQATAVTWGLEDVDREVKTLREKGITFEHYEFPDTKLEGDVHVSGHMRAAWFKDPDGNIHALVSGG